MGAIKTEPPVGVRARRIAWNIGVGKREPTMNLNVQIVIALAVPWVPQGNAHVAATIAAAIVNNHPLKSMMLALGKDVLGTVDSN